MDLELYLRVIWRFKWLVATGCCVAFGLAVLSLFHVSPSSPHLRYRTAQQWKSTETLLVTERGAPWLSSGYSKNADPSRYSVLATIYVQLVMSNDVRNLIGKAWPLTKYDVIQAYPVLAQSYNSNSPPLPLISVEVMSYSATRSQELARHATAAFRDYLADLQAKNDIRTDKRVVVTTVRSYEPPVMMAGPSKTLPIVVFLTVMMGIAGLCLLLENMRPRARPVVLDDAQLLRRSA
jgi:hypothetical protein